MQIFGYFCSYWHLYINNNSRATAHGHLYSNNNLRATAHGQDRIMILQRLLGQRTYPELKKKHSRKRTFKVRFSDVFTSVWRLPLTTNNTTSLFKLQDQRSRDFFQSRTDIKTNLKSRSTSTRTEKRQTYESEPITSTSREDVDTNSKESWFCKMCETLVINVYVGISCVTKGYIRLTTEDEDELVKMPLNWLAL